MAGRRVTESGARAFLRYIKTVPCVAATAVAVAAATAMVMVAQYGMENRRSGGEEENGANDDVISDVITWEHAHGSSRRRIDGPDTSVSAAIGPRDR